jgi:heat shock protein 5
LAAVKETTEWLDEHPEAEAEDYEDKLSELQSTVAVSAAHAQGVKDPS